MAIIFNCDLRRIAAVAIQGVCPIHCHFRRSMIELIDSRLVLLRSSSFDIRFWPENPIYYLSIMNNCSLLVTLTVTIDKHGFDIDGAITSSISLS